MLDDADDDDTEFPDLDRLPHGPWRISQCEGVGDYIIKSKHGSVMANVPWDAGGADQEGYAVTLSVRAVPEMLAFVRKQARDDNPDLASRCEARAILEALKDG